MKTSRVVSCESCGLVIHEPTDIRSDLREPFPSCGSTVRHVELHVFDAVTVHDFLLPKLLFGEIRVKVAEKPVEAANP